MPWLSMNGLELSVSNDSAIENVREIGATEASFDGTLRRTRQGVKRDLSFKTPPLTGAEAYFWGNWIRGIGEVWSFESSLYGSKGTGPTSSTGCTQDSSPAKHGTYSLEITSTNTFAVAGYTSGGSVTTILWHYESGAWHHYVIDGNEATVYRDGSSYATPLDWFAASGGTVTLTASGGVSHNFDDMVILPFSVPTGYWDDIYSWHDTNSWGALPALKCMGDIIPEAQTRTMMGDVTESRPLKAYLSGSFTTVARTLSVGLREA